MSRALGIALTPKAEKILDKRPSWPCQHGTSRHVLSDYGRRLREQQRPSEKYFISEAHLRRKRKRREEVPVTCDEQLVIEHYAR